MMNTTRLLQFSKQFQKFYANRFAALLERRQLSMREMDVLLFLVNNPGYDTARDITEFRGISKSQVSQAVDLLTAEGLLQRTPDTADRRVVHLSLTEDGAPLAAEALAIQSACVQQLISGLTTEQQEQLKVMLDIVLDNGARLAEEAV